MQFIDKDCHEGSRAVCRFGSNFTGHGKIAKGGNGGFKRLIGCNRKIGANKCSKRTACGGDFRHQVRSTGNSHGSFAISDKINLARDGNNGTLCDGKAACGFFGLLNRIAAIDTLTGTLTAAKRNDSLIFRCFFCFNIV